MAETNDSSSLYSLWSIQDTLLQYYRTMFLTAESLILAVAASATSFTLASVGMLFIGLVLLCVWVLVTYSRARDVSFAQELIKWHEGGRQIESPLTTFKNYQTEWSKSGSYTISFRDGSTEKFQQDGVWPPRDCKLYQIWRWNARVQMERVLPSAYLLFWLAIVINICTRTK